MLYEVINFLVKELNAHFRIRKGITEDLVLLYNVTNQDQSILPETENKIIACLVGIEEERIKKDVQTYIKSQDSYGKLSPPVYINFSMIFGANFSKENYPEALKAINEIIRFFQVNNLFITRNYTELNTDMEKLVAEIVNLDFHAMSNLWNTLGSKYMPSIVYRYRYLSYHEQVPRVEGQVIKGF